MILRHLATFPTIKIINSVPKLVDLVGVWQLRTMKLCSVLSHMCVRPGSLMVSSSVMLNALEVCQNCVDLQVTVIARLLNPLIWVGLKVHFFSYEIFDNFTLYLCLVLEVLNQNSSSILISVINIRGQLGSLGAWIYTYLSCMLSYPWITIFFFV